VGDGAVAVVGETPPVGAAEAAEAGAGAIAAAVARIKVAGSAGRARRRMGGEWRMTVGGRAALRRRTAPRVYRAAGRDRSTCKTTTAAQQRAPS
jgi:hypothetical protein